MSIDKLKAEHPPTACDDKTCCNDGDPNSVDGMTYSDLVAEVLSSRAEIERLRHYIATNKIAMPEGRS